MCVNKSLCCFCNAPQLFKFIRNSRAVVITRARPAQQSPLSVAGAVHCLARSVPSIIFTLVSLLISLILSHSLSFSLILSHSLSLLILSLPLLNSFAD